MKISSGRRQGVFIFFPLTDGYKAGKLWCQAMEEAGLSVTEPLSLPGEALWKIPGDGSGSLYACMLHKSCQKGGQRFFLLAEFWLWKEPVLLFCLASFLMMVLSLSCCLYEAVSLWKAEKVMKDMAPVAAAHAKWVERKRMGKSTG